MMRVFLILLLSLLMIASSHADPLVIAGRNNVHASFDGHNFTLVGSIGANVDGRTIHVIDHDRYVNFVGAIRASQNGSEWDVLTNSGTAYLQSGTYSRDKDTFVAVGSAGKVMSSVGLNNYSSPSTPTSANIRDVSYNGSHFLMPLSSAGLIMTSEDGFNFDIINTSKPLALWSIAQRPSDGLFVITANHNTVDNVYYGYDLENLSVTSVGSTYGVIVRYYDDIDSFVIGHNSRRVSLSSDGENWDTVDAMLANVNVYDVEYSKRLNRLFVSGSSGRVSYSNDLSSFTLANIDEGYNQIRVLAVRDVPLLSPISVDSFGSFEGGSYSGSVVVSSQHDYFNTIECVTSFDNGSSFVSTTQTNDTHAYDSYNCAVDEIVSVVFSCSDDDFLSNVTTPTLSISCFEVEEEGSGSVVVNVNFIDPALLVFVLVAGLMILLAVKIHPLFYGVVGMLLVISGLIITIEPILMAFLMIIGSFLVVVSAFMTLTR